MNTLLKLFFIALFSILMISACTEETTEAPVDLVETIRFFNEKNQYDEAFQQLKTEEAREHEHYDQLLLATHMNYALHLTYEAEQVPMTTRMPDALRHFRKVVELDPENERAKAEILLIEGIYKQLGRPIPEGTAN